MEKYTEEQLLKIIKHYESQSKSWELYNEKQRQKKKDEGVYKKAGRPRKVKEVVLVQEPV